ncbi:zinc finger protein 185 [Cyprinodon tularosa]|uniref:zinc finger protein 185 n=1 Tax=Cyprinodon tularosa TaxID=77115 RepID=UPI0018E20DF8|nr:zinc finger protein 185 [Cyprinodon tularosa]
MSADFGKKKVFQQIKVSHEFKEDNCWIKRPEEDSVTSEKKQKLAPPKKGSYIQSILRRFEGSPIETNNEINPGKYDAPLEERRGNTARDTTTTSPAEKLVNKPEPQKQMPVINTNGQKKEVGVEAPADESNMEDNMVPVKVPADVDKEQEIQPAPSATENVDAADKPAEVEGKTADTEPKIVAKQLFSDLQEPASVTDTEEVPATPLFIPKPQEEALIRAEPANTRSLGDAGEEESVLTKDGSAEKSLQQERNGEILPAVSQFTVQEMAENSAAPDEDISPQATKESDIQFETVSKSLSQFDNETPVEGSCEKQPQEQDNKEAEVENVMATPKVDNATPSEEAPPHNSMQPGTNTPSESHSDAEDVVVAVKCEVDQEAIEEPVLKSRTEEAVEAEIQPVNSTAVERHDEPSVENEQVDLNIEDVHKAIPPGDDGAVLDASDFKAIDLTDALDMKVPQNASVPEPEESKGLNQEELYEQRDDTKDSNGIQKPEEEPNSTKAPKTPRDEKSICSYCLNVIDGCIKLYFNYPPMACHPECLKCGVCEKAIGDLNSRIFLHDKVIHCNDCFSRVLNI